METQERKEVFQELLDAQRFDKEFVEKIKELFPEMFEEDKPERVRKVFVAEYDKVDNYEHSGALREFFVDVVTRYFKWTGANPTVTELQPYKSKQKLVEEIRRRYKIDSVHDKVEQIIDLINSSYICGE